MRRLVRLAAASVAAVLLVALAAGLYVGGVHLTHPRDETAYLKGLADEVTEQSDGSQSDGSPVVLPDRDVLIAEGQRACDWLAAQPHALWRSADRYKPVVVMNRYVDQALRPTPWAGPPDAPTVADAAWRHLCPATVEMRRPLPGFRGPSD